MKYLTRLIVILTVLCLTSLVGSSQVLADTLKNSLQKYFAPVLKNKKVKRIYYSFSFPQLDSMNINNKGKVTSSKWTNDTVLVSHFYDTNGYYVAQSETLRNGKLNKKTEYIYDDLGN